MPIENDGTSILFEYGPDEDEPNGTPDYDLMDALNWLETGIPPVMGGLDLLEPEIIRLYTVAKNVRAQAEAKAIRGK